MSTPSLAMLGPRTPENGWTEIPHPLKLCGVNEKIVNNSAVDYSISLKFCTEFKQMTSEVP